MLRGFKGPVTVVSPEAKAYKNQVAQAVRYAGFRHPIAGKVAVHLQLYPKRPQDWEKRQAADPLSWDQSVKCLDIDNARKVLYDALGGVLFDDDRWIWKDSAERMVPDGEARVIVSVMSLREIKGNQTYGSIGISNHSAERLYGPSGETMPGTIPGDSTGNGHH